MTTNFTQQGVLLESNSLSLQTIPEASEEVSEDLKRKHTVSTKPKTPAKSPGGLKSNQNTANSDSSRPALNFLDQIRARRKSGAGVKASTPTKSPVRVLTPKRTMRTPLRQAIESRRQSIATPKVATKSTTTSQKKTPLRRESSG